MKTIKDLYPLLIAMLVLACGEGAATEARTAQSGSVSPAVNRTYEKGVPAQACDVMPPEMVARLFELPAEEIEGRGGKSHCRYRRNTDDHSFYAHLTSIQVFDDVEKAKRWYDNLTRNATHEDIEAQKDEIDREIDEEEDLETGTEKETAKTLTGLFAALTPDGGLRHEPVEGLADEAKIDNESATIRLRSGNMIFYVAAYSGPRKPITGTSDMKEIMAEERAWNAKALPDRARAAIQLAREVVPRIEALSN